MGHIRLGRLPRYQSWRRVITAISNGSSPEVLALVTAKAAGDYLKSMRGDKSLATAFWFLVRVIHAGRKDDFVGALTELGIHAPLQRSSGMTLASAVVEASRHYLQESSLATPSREISELSLRQALTAVISQRSRSLFGTTIDDIHAACREKATKVQFSGVARQFFATFLAKTLSYVIDKETSNHIGPDQGYTSTDDIQRIHQGLKSFGWETARIVEVFSGSWYSKHNFESGGAISLEESTRFVAHALKKMQMEMAQRSQE